MRAGGGAGKQEWCLSLVFRCASNPIFRAWALECAVFLAALALRLAVVAHTPPADDAFITFRYAAKLASGVGFVFNDGAHVLGTTTPLLTLLLAVPGRLGLDIAQAGLAVSVLASALCCSLLFGTIRTSDGSLAGAAVGALLLGLGGAQAYAAASGMETALMCALMLGSYRLLLAHRMYAGGLLAGLVAVTRPEGLVWLLLYLVFLRREDRWHWRAAAVGLLPVLLWGLFATLYFGSAVPRSVGVKLELGRAMTLGWAWSVDMLLSPLGPPLYLGLLAVAGVLLAGRRRHELLLPLGFALAFVAVYATLHPKIFPWYPGPLDTVACLTMAAVAADALSPTRRDTTARQRRAQLGYAGIVTVCLAMVLTARARGYPAYLSPPTIPETRLVLARWLHEHSRPTDTLLVGDLGYAGYYNLDRRVVDYFGLVLPALRMPDRVAPNAALVSDLVREAVRLERPKLVVLPRPSGSATSELLLRYPLPPGYQAIETPSLPDYHVLSRPQNSIPAKRPAGPVRSALHRRLLAPV